VWVPARQDPWRTVRHEAGGSPTHRFAVMHHHATGWRDPGVVPFDDLQQMAGHGQAPRHLHALIPDERSRDLCGRLDALCGARLALLD
jgi:hypothetical protein